MHIQHNNTTNGNNSSSGQNHLKQAKSKCEAESNYANLNLNSRDQKHGKAKEIHSLDTNANKLKDCLPIKEEIQYAALHFKSKAYSPNTEEEINYAVLHFHSDNSNRLKSILPIANEIILNPSNVANNTNKDNDVTTHTFSKNNDNPQRKKSCKWQTVTAVVTGICAILLIAAVIVWNKKDDISQKGSNMKKDILTPFSTDVMAYYHKTEDVDEHNKAKTNKHVTPGKPTVYTTEPEKTSQPILIQTHPTEMLRNSATKGKRLLQSKPKPKCNFRDINTFKNCYVVRNDKKTLLNSRKQCQKIGMQLADMDSREELNFVKTFIKKQYKIDSGQFIEKARKARKLDPVDGFLEKTWLNLFGIPKGRNQKERAQSYNKKGWLIGDLVKTWTKTFGEYNVPNQAYWVSHVLNASDGTPTTYLRRMQRKGNVCMSISAEGNNRTDCQHKLPFICEYNKWG